MGKLVLLNFVKQNRDALLQIFNSTFLVNEQEFNEIIFQILSIDFEKDDFYAELFRSEHFYECFNIENLMNLRNFLMQIGLSDVSLKRVINDVPEIVLLSNKTESIYPLFKCDDFKGIAFLQGNYFKSFMLPKLIDFYKVKRFRNYDFSIEYDSLLQLEYYNQYENKETVSGLIDSLGRTDVMVYYGLTSSSSLKEKFDALATVFDQYNYYFYRPKNLLLERKAKQTAVDENGMYCCDLCSKKSMDPEFLSTKHVVPIQMGGKDDIYNVACLCDECQERVANNSINLAKTEQILYGLKRRIYDHYPQYRNVLLSWFNISSSSYERIMQH